MHLGLRPPDLVDDHAGSHWNFLGSSRTPHPQHKHPELCFQMDSLRFLLDNDDELIRRNFRPVRPISLRHIFHILPSTSKYSTLLPAPVQDVGEKITQIYRIQLLYCKEVDEKRKLMQAQKQRANVECLFRRTNFSHRDLLSKTESAVSSLSKYTDFIF